MREKIHFSQLGLWLSAGWLIANFVLKNVYNWPEFFRLKRDSVYCLPFMVVLVLIALGFSSSVITFVFWHGGEISAPQFAIGMDELWMLRCLSVFIDRIQAYNFRGIILVNGNPRYFSLDIMHMDITEVIQHLYGVLQQKYSWDVYNTKLEGEL